MTQEQFNELPDFIQKKLIACGATPDQIDFHEEDEDEECLLRALFGDSNDESEDDDSVDTDTDANVDENRISPDALAKVLIASGITDPKTIESITGLPVEKTAGMGANATADDYVVTVTYSVMGHYRVRAASIEDAINTVAAHADSLPLLNHPARMPESVKVVGDTDYTAAINNTNVAHVTESHLVSRIAKHLDKKSTPADEQ